MPPIVHLNDQEVCVATLDYPHAKWKFEKLNPVQSRMMEVYNKDMNGLIAASTSAGKTVVAEMFLAQEIRERGGKGMFLAPLRALAREKINDWKGLGYHFSDLNISICTGDYRLTKERSQELNDANLIIMTSEMLSHRSRNYKSEQNQFLKEVGTLVLDESHLLTVPGRGDHLEVGLMKFTQINPKARLILLSATMPNVEEIAEWISYMLTGRETFVLRSKYRPVPLITHYEPYSDDMGRYDLIEKEKINKAMDIVEWYKSDKFLIFAHTKRTGEMMKKELQSAGIEAEFHNADLETSQRAKLEDRFKNDPEFRVIVATSGLAWGLNLPARRVIILGVHRGVEEVESHDILQMVGRSGRYGIDPMGDAYILVPESKMRIYTQKYSAPRRIESQLLEKTGSQHKSLAFHLVSEIFFGGISTTDDFHNWYKRSLAHYQNKQLHGTVVDDTLELLRKCGAIGQEDGKWTARPIGKISSMFYISPFDVSDLYFGFKSLFDSKREEDDYALSITIANLDSQRMNIVSKAEKDEISLYANKIRVMMTGKFLTDGCIKAGYCYFNLLTGNNSQVLAAFQRNLQQDYNRISQVLQAMDAMTGQWDRSGWFKTLEFRIASGVPAHLIDLCKIANIGKARATKLYDSGYKTSKDLSKLDAAKLSKLINVKLDMAQEMLQSAKGKSIDFFEA